MLKFFVGERTHEQVNRVNFIEYWKVLSALEKNKAQWVEGVCVCTCVHIHRGGWNGPG